MNVIGNDKYLGGQLVGIGKVHRDGSEDFRWLDKPIHNRITSVGLDHLLCFNGQTSGGLIGKDVGAWPEANAWTSPYIGRIGNSGSSGQPVELTTHYGALHFCAFGDNDAPTEFTDIGLKHQISDYSATHKLSGETWYKGTRKVSDGIYRHRVTYVMNALDVDSIAREIGIFGRYARVDENIYPMFARIVLDAPIEVLSGEQLIVTYELHETIAGKNVEYFNDFFGMTDPDGVPLHYARRMYCNSTQNAGMNCIRGMGTGSVGNCSDDSDANNTFVNLACGGNAQLFYTRNHSYNNSSGFHPVAFSTDRNKNFPALYYTDGASMNFYNGFNLDVPRSFVDYTGVGTNDKHRDFRVTWGPMIPSPEEYIDIYYLRINGMDYRFGYLEEDGTTWHPQALRKYNNQTFTFTLRTAYHTEDTL